MTFTFIKIMDILGTVAFALSGAAVAARKRMDIFGINILALVTATGGGIIRDIVIGVTPPTAFKDPLFLIIALITANSAFAVMYIRRRFTDNPFTIIPDRAMFWFDTMGLAAFSAGGAAAGFNSDYISNISLIIFLGVVTGVGGGIMRDILALETPYVFIKHVYALASLAGALCTGLMMSDGFNLELAILTGFCITILIRVLAARFRWNLPRIY